MVKEPSTPVFAQTDLLAMLGDLENQRRQAVAWLGKIALGILFAGAGVIGMLQLAHAEYVWSITAGVTAFLVWAIIAGTRYTRFVKNYKQRVIPYLLATLDPGLIYRPGGGIDKSEFERSGLFSRPDRYRSQDYVAGHISKTDFYFSLVHAEREVETTTTDSDGNSQTETHFETIFQGLFFSADFNKYFAGHTRVFAGGIHFLSGLRGGLVKLEDPGFNRSFTVTSTDQVEARYILSPALMRRLLELRRQFDAEVQAAFVGSRVIITVPSRMDLLQPRFFRRADNLQVVRGYLDFLQGAIDLVEDLNLNTRIWTKR